MQGLGRWKTITSTLFKIWLQFPLDKKLQIRLDILLKLFLRMQFIVLIINCYFLLFYSIW